MTVERKDLVTFVTQNGDRLVSKIDNTGFFFSAIVACVYYQYLKRQQTDATARYIMPPAPFDAAKSIDTFVSVYANTPVQGATSPEDQVAAIVKLNQGSEEDKDDLNQIVVMVRDIYKFGHVSSKLANENINDHLNNMGAEAKSIYQKIMGKV